MPSALVPLANITVGSSVTSVTFSSISTSYRDLMIVASNLTASSSVTYAALRFNSDITNYYNVAASGDGSTATSNGGGPQSYIWLPGYGSFSTTDNGNYVSHILDWNQTDKHKMVLTRLGAAASKTEMTAYRWASTSAITSIQISTGGQPAWASGASFVLYGVSA